MKKVINYIVMLFLIMVSILYIFPYAWKYSGGTFLWGGEMIYKGKTLFERSDCAVVFENDYSKIELICPGQKKRTWINGKLSIAKQLATNNFKRFIV